MILETLAQSCPNGRGETSPQRHGNEKDATTQRRSVVTEIRGACERCSNGDDHERGSQRRFAGSDSCAQTQRGRDDERKRDQDENGNAVWMRRRRRLGWQQGRSEGQAEKTPGPFEEDDDEVNVHFQRDDGA
jgi:hypothetical protein